MPPMCCVIGRGWTENTASWPKSVKDIDDFERTDYLIDPTGHSLLGGIGGPWLMNKSTAFYIDIEADCGADLVADITKKSKELDQLESAFYWVWFENVGPEPTQNAMAMKNAVKLSKKYVVVNGGNVNGLKWGQKYMQPFNITNLRYVDVTVRTYVPGWYLDELEEIDEPISNEGLTKITGAKLKNDYKGKGVLSFRKPKAQYSWELVDELLPDVAEYYYVEEKHPLIYGEVHK